MTEPLPAETNERVVEVRFSHVALAFALLAGTGLAIGLTIVVTRDYLKTRRQQALIESTTQIIQTLKENTPWKEPNKESLSQTKT